MVPGEHCQKIAVSNPTQAGQRFTWSKTWCDKTTTMNFNYYLNEIKIYHKNKYMPITL